MRSGQSVRLAKEKLCEVVFGGLNFARFQFTCPAQNALYATGSITGLVLDCGESQTSIYPLYEGNTLTEAVMQSTVAGSSVLDTVLAISDTKMAGTDFSIDTTYQKEICLRNMVNSFENSSKAQKPIATF